MGHVKCTQTKYNLLCSQKSFFTFDHNRILRLLLTHHSVYLIFIFDRGIYSRFFYMLIFSLGLLTIIRNAKFSNKIFGRNISTRVALMDG